MHKCVCVPVCLSLTKESLTTEINDLASDIRKLVPNWTFMAFNKTIHCTLSLLSNSSSNSFVKFLALSLLLLSLLRRWKTQPWQDCSGDSPFAQLPGGKNIIPGSDPDE